MLFINRLQISYKAIAMIAIKDEAKIYRKYISHSFIHK